MKIHAQVTIKKSITDALLIARDKDRTAAVKKTNIVFLCPICYMNLRKICRDDGTNPVFITEMCKKALAA